jgi:hypothetical protein
MVMVMVMVMLLVLVMAMVMVMVMVMGILIVTHFCVRTLTSIIAFLDCLMLLSYPLTSCAHKH